ncbi:uncharacterized protein SPAPADRAFT_63273 [Spathaspora passalidarum NRRL Y-27907]|uniref:Peroxin 20 n=1 Tax=Spathaspora passalidarum (strain NRRL Y-27907 / 11-Y1) TaxID=619300 RepID=G3AU56_SPAPN|nr:uncharacterized protein SPAPADRAFT_63273 [Spathaspora passalidarum NRRL Y-27907]EGW30432.1 hypothetical protein SPAPADRAFT_63273 [Spathaspora passalidarum NRRL Y-27907]
MDSASCGPTSALQNLSKHAQRDTSLQHSQSRNIQTGANPIHGFRSGNIDPRLNNDFQRFNQSGDIGGQAFMNNVRLQTESPQIQGQPQMMGQPGWVNDFSNLSINKSTQQHPIQSNDWQQQFMQIRQQQQAQPQAQVAQGSQITPGYMSGRLNYGMNSMVQSHPVYEQQSEHQEVHKMEQQQKQFESQFDMIEQELMAQARTAETDAVEIEIADSNNAKDKEEFAQTARKVQSAMLSANSQDEEMQNKINNSSFLKLMNSIGNRHVELEGDKLVDVASGQDIREQQQNQEDIASAAPRTLDNHCIVDNPVHHDGWVQDGQINLQQQRAQSSDVKDPAHENKLPDPLAHIKDGQLEDINDPFTAARIISGGQVQANDWMDDVDWLDQTVPAPHINRMMQESYDDYRHEDDLQ